MNTHLDFMQHAIRLAERGLGRCWPNPSVGCVIVKDGIIVGTGVTGENGRPHAETQALEMAGDAARGATLYVTLEPCAHHGQTPPCADAIIAAGIAEVVCALRDPDARTNGQGIARLREAGLRITEGVGTAEAENVNQGFITRVTQGRPMISLKVATTLDGMMATAQGKSQWITGEPARIHGHSLRASHDATLTGIGTVLADNPRLTCRLSGLEHRPSLRIVLDSRLHMPEDAAMVQTIAEHPLWVITGPAMLNTPRAELLAKHGARVIPSETDEHGYLHLPSAMKALAKEGITRLLVEAGPTVTTGFVRERLLDWLYWFRAPSLIGNGGRPAIGILPDAPLDTLLRGKHHQSMALGEDRLDVYKLAG